VIGHPSRGYKRLWMRVIAINAHNLILNASAGRVNSITTV
jgi:hypothetical protein